MEELSQKIKTTIEQARKVMSDGIGALTDILSEDMEIIRLRKELRKLGYREEARRARYHYVDLDKDGEAERYVLLKALMRELIRGDPPDDRLCTFDGTLLEDTGIIRKALYSSEKSDILVISYYKEGDLIREIEKIQLQPTVAYRGGPWG